MNLLNAEFGKGEYNIPVLVMSDRKSQGELQRLLDSFASDEINHAKTSLVKIAEARLQQEDQNATISPFFPYILEGASSLLMERRLDRLKTITEKEGYAYFFDPTIQFYKFGSTGDINIKMQGISIKDVVNNPNLSASSAYRFLVAPYLEGNNIKAFNENKTPLAIKYPNVAKNNVILASNELLSMTFMGEKGDFETVARTFLPNPRGAEKTIISTAKEIIGKISVLKKKISNTILDSNSPEFQELKGIAEKFLSNENIRDLAILQLGIADGVDEIIAAYRKTKELGQANTDNSIFYKNLASYIETFVAGSPVLTQDDLDSLIDTDITLDNVIIPTPEDLRKLGISIFQKSNKKEYTMEPDATNWESPLPPPLYVEVVFPQGNPIQVYAYLHYQSKKDEVLDLVLKFDAKRGKFYWNVLDAPDDPEMKSKKDAVLLAAKSILSDVQKQAETECQQKQKERQTKAQTPQTIVRQPRPKETYVPREKVAKEKRTRPLTSFQEALQSKMSFPIQPEQQRVKNQIVIKGDQEINEMAKNVSFQDRELVVRAISEYNQRNVGQFKRLRYSGQEKEPLFSLRVNTGQGGGGIRVLMHEVPNPSEADNTRAFEILDIDYRKNIYRKRGL